MSTSSLKNALDFHKNGDFVSAEKIYRNIIVNSKEKDMALYFLGLICSQTARIQEGVDYLLQAISLNPEPAYYKDLGDIYQDNKYLDQAVNCYLSAIKLDPSFIEAIYELGKTYLLKNDYQKAEEAFLSVLAVDSGFVEALTNLGIIEYFKKDFNKAILYYKKAIELNPNSADFYNNLGNIYKDNKDLQEALNCYSNAIKLDPLYSKAYFNTGLLMHMVNQLDSALFYYQQAIALDPTYLDPYINMGAVFRYKLDVDAELESYKKALEMYPEHPSLNFNKGTANLLKMNFDEGFKGYEWRSKLYPHHELRYPEKIYPKWDGEASLESKTILTYCSGSTFAYGDTIMFARYLPLFVKKGAKVLCLPQKGLEILLKEADLGVELIDDASDVPFDYQIPIMSLAWAFKSNAETIPFKDKYLKVNKDKAEYYNQKYFDNKDFKIGIVWRAGLGYDEKSFELSNFYGLNKFKNVKVYSLQKGYGLDELEQVNNNLQIVNIGKEFKDFSDTLAAISNLDLVITVDTSVAHLAGAIGKPTWVLLPYSADWRWFLNIQETPWYNSMKLYRQDKLNNWSSAFSKVYRDLYNLLS